MITGVDALYAAHVAALSKEYARCIEAHGFDAAVIHGGFAHKRSEFDDQYWPLRATPHFQHWVPLAEPDAALVVRPGHKPVLARVPCASFWEAPRPPESEHFSPYFEHLTLPSADALRAELPAGRLAFIGEDRAQAARWGIPESRQNPESLLGSLDALRTRKSAYERACIAEANRRAAPGHRALRRAFLDGPRTELELHLAYLGATAQDDAETPYKNIVALDRNAATLHHIAYARGASPRARALLVDAGACCMGYCSDITRTWVRAEGDAAAERFAALVHEIDAMQRRLCEAVSPGVGYESLHDRAHELLGAVLGRVGLVRCSAEEAVASGVTRAFLPHGLGHSLGLQCHDVGCAVVKPRADNPFLRNTSIIEAGQVFTIEPGVYFIEGLLGPLREGPLADRVNWAEVDALAPFGGVRVEDDLFVTGDPARPVENFTRDALGD